MSALMHSSNEAARVERDGGLFRRRLMSRSDVKRLPGPGRSQNRPSMRGGCA